jgi:glycosyltransferase involved in cell wall biosynthesis
MAKQKRIYVSVTNDLVTDQRVHKVCQFLFQEGFLVTLIGRELENSLPLQKRDYKTIRFKLKHTKGPKFYASFNFKLFRFLLFKKINVLVSNDLDTLLGNYIITKFRPNTKLVYDTHEYFTEVPELINRPKTKQIWEAIEAWIFPKLRYIYTVNDSIAQLYHKKYNKTIQIVRNISPTWEPKSIPTKKELGIPENKFLIILQGAGINIDRGAEEAVGAMQHVNGATLLIVGGGDVIDALKQQVVDLGLSEKVLFFGKRPYQEMMAYTFHAQIGLTLDKDSNLNYRYSLPNKVFDYIHAETPIISSNLIEITKIIESHQVGKIIEKVDPDEIYKAINYLMQNPQELEQLKENCRNTKQFLNWETETETLKNIYNNFG